MKTSLFAKLPHRELESLLGSIRRYTRFVSFTKIILLLLAAGLLVLVVALPLRTSDDSGIRIVFSGIEQGDASVPELVNPRFEGIDDQGQPYTVTATSAIQHDLNRVTMHTLKADITFLDGKWIAMMADQGELDMTVKTLALDGNVNAFYDGGYEMRTQNVFIDMGKGTAESKTPVVGQGPLGTLQASGFTVVNRGESIYFTGPVRLVLYTKGK